MIALRALILTIVGALLFYLLYRVLKKGGRRSGLFTLWLAEPITVLFGDGSPDPLHSNPKAKPFREALRGESFAKAQAYLASLEPGDRVEIPFREALHPRSGHPVSLADGWIGDYSGRYVQRSEEIGQPTALKGETFYGTHVFGYLHGHHHLIPAYRLITQAQACWDLSPDSANDQRFGEIGSIWVDGSERKLFIRDVVVHEVLSMEDPANVDSELKELELIDEPADVEAVFKEPLTPERFQRAERILRQLPKGCDRWEMIRRMEGRIVTPTGVEAVLCMDGYLNFIGTHRWFKITPEGIYLAQPFGYLEGREEVPRLVAVFLNDRFHKLLPFSPKEELEQRLGI